MQIIGLVFLILLVAYIFYDYNTNIKYKIGKVYIRSIVDNQVYLVNDIPDKQNVADSLGTLNLNLSLFKKELNRINVKTEQLQRFLKKIDKMTINESSLQDYNTFVINKTDIYFCVKDDTNKFYDNNVLVYVLLHELSHIYSYSEGHTQEFIKNFKFLVDVAKKIGIYTKIDFENNNQLYCGVNIKNNL
jgi:predicted metallo-beta-lactamase superfamily hydrolase